MATTSSGSSAAAVSESFLSAYDEVLAAKWPVGTTHSDVPTPYGTTRINSYGAEGAPPLVLLAGAAPPPPSGSPRPPTWAAPTASMPSTSSAIRAAVRRGSARSVRCRT